MKWAFWLSLVFITFTYAGYPAWLWVRARWRPRPVRPMPIVPSVSIVMAVHDEAAALPGKLKNLTELDYPSERYEVVVVSDGSTDATNAILASWAGERRRFVLLETHQGKAAALNCGVRATGGLIVVFTDARQQLAPDAVGHLVANFADLSVGCVSGELLLTESMKERRSLSGVGLYWQFEKRVRQCEAAVGSAIGATGAIYAIRKELFVPLPVGTILDDVYLPLQVVRLGRRSVFEPRARACDLVTTARVEFRRKVRTLTGNYQLLQVAPWLLTLSNPVLFAFVCHKLLRLMIPFALGTLLVSSFWLHGALGKSAVTIQLIFYALAGLGALRPRLGAVSRLADAALAFLVLNVAAAVAFVHFVSGKKTVWVR